MSRCSRAPPERINADLEKYNRWRVVLDEAQMVESGVSNAAKVAKLIPRDISWYVNFPAVHY